MRKKEVEGSVESAAVGITEGNWNLGDAKALQKQIENYVKASGGSSAIAETSFIKDILRSTFQALLNVEMEEHLGRDKYERAEESEARVQRNGKTARVILGN